MPLIRRRRIPLPLKHMPQMAPAIVAYDLRPFHPERAIRVPLHSARQGVEIRRPAAAGLEFVRGFVERRVTAGTGVHALLGLVGIVFAGVGRFGAFFAEDAELFCSSSCLVI